MESKDSLRARLRDHMLSSWTLPLLVCICMALGTLVFWRALSENEHDKIQNTIDTQSLMVTEHVMDELEVRLATLDRMADRWEFRGRPTPSQWQQDAILNVTDFPGFRSIQWMDANYQVEWVVPSDGNETSLGFNHTIIPARRDALVHARQSGEMVVSTPVNLANGGRGFIAYRPVFINPELIESTTVLQDNFDGFIVGTFTIADLFTIALRDPVVIGYSVAILSEGQEIYLNGEQDRRHEVEWSAEQAFTLAGRDWQVRVWPSEAQLSQQRSALSGVALAGGLLLSVLMLALVRVIQLAHARANEARRLSAVLSASALALEESNRGLEEFAYVASHDLKAPLVSLRGMADILTEDYGNTLPADGQLYLSRISANATRMQNLLDDVLQMSRLRQADAPLVQVDLNSVVQSVTEQLSQSLSEQSATVRVLDTLPVVRGNAMWLNQVLANLIDNAVKYASSDRDPLIEIGCRERAEAWEVFVCDNGPGIPAAHRDRVFGMFQRLPNGQTANPGGSGMGLAIVTRGVEAHGGRVWIDESSEAGTTFAFTIAKSDSAQPRTHSNGRSGSASVALK